MMKSNFYYVKLSVSHPGPLNHPMNAAPLLLPQFQFGSNLATNELSGLNIAEISCGSSVIISMNAALIVHGFSCSSILATFEEFEKLKLSCTYEAKNILQTNDLLKANEVSGLNIAEISPKSITNGGQALIS